MTAELRPIRRETLPGVDSIGLVAIPVLTALAAVVAAWPWRRGLEVPGAVGWIIVAAVVPVTLTAVLARILRQPPVSSYAASLIGLVVVIEAVAGLHPGTVAHTLATEPSRLLSETLPLDGSPNLLVVPLTVVWVASAVMAETLTRARRAHVALAIPIASYLVAFGATAGAPGHDDASGAWLLAVTAVLAAAMRLDHERRGAAVRPDDPGAAATRRRWTRRALVGAALAVVLAIGLADGVPRLQSLAGNPASLRRRPVTAAPVIVNPVDAVQSLRDSDPGAAATALFAVTTSQPSTGYLGIADLDNYDGDDWTFDTTFEPTGGRVPPGRTGLPGSVTAQDTVVDQHYRLGAAYPLPFIPTLDRPTDLTGLSVDADPNSGAVVTARPLTPPSSYAVASRAPDVTFDGIPSAYAFARTAGDGVDLAVPEGAAQATHAISQFETAITGQRPTGSLGFMRALVAGLRRDEHRRLPDPGVSTPPAHGGTSLAEVVQAVTVDRSATPEQFATFVAVAARELGVPARLVTGFRTETAAAGRPLPPGTTTVTNRDAWTWDEFPVVGLGWVVVDATPTRTATGSSSPPVPGSATVKPAAPLDNAVPIFGGPGGGRAVAPPVKTGLAGRPSPSTWRRDVLAALVAALVLAAAGPVAAAGRRWWRRRARRSPDGATLAVGAWLELLDGFEIAGLRVAGHATSAEVVTTATAHFGDEVVRGSSDVAATAEQAVCAPNDPPDPATAAASWDMQRRIGRRARRSLPLGSRLRAVVQVGHQRRRPVDTRAAEAPHRRLTRSRSSGQGRDRNAPRRSQRGAPRSTAP